MTEPVMAEIVSNGRGEGVPPDETRLHWNSKFTPERQQALLEAARKGLSESACAALAGISSRTLRTWLEAEDNPDDPKHEFAMAFLRNLAEWEQEMLEKASVAADDNVRSGWEFRTMWLSRRKRADWGEDRKVRVEHSAVGELESRLHELNAERGLPRGN